MATIIKYDPKVIQDACPPPPRVQENRLTNADAGYTICTTCQKILWMEDLADALTRK